MLYQWVSGSPASSRNPLRIVHSVGTPPESREAFDRLFEGWWDAYKDIVLFGSDFYEVYAQLCDEKRPYWQDDRKMPRDRRTSRPAKYKGFQCAFAEHSIRLKRGGVLFITESG